MRYLLLLFIVIFFSYSSFSISLDVFPSNNSVLSNLSSTILSETSSSSPSSTWIDWNDSLKGYWGFNTLIGSNISDLSSFNDTIFATGDIVVDSSNRIRGNYLSLDGSGDYVFGFDEIPESEGTVSFWFRTGSSSSQVIYFSGPSTEDGFSSGGSRPSITLGVTSNYLRGSVERSSDADLVTFYNDTLNSSSWFHIVHTWRGNSFHRLYVNGDLAVDNSLSFTPSISQERIYLGRPGTNERYFNGDLDELLIFDRAIASSEVMSLYNSQLSSFFYGPLSLENLTYYNFSLFGIDMVGDQIIYDSTFFTNTSYMEPQHGSFTSSKFPAFSVFFSFVFVFLYFIV
ncbi:MAG: LamG domain-containing protein [Nanoarchaeota archaeon]|nr:LamG domain-containing protein [Nanoarchaeota archaeon]